MKKVSFGIRNVITVAVFTAVIMIVGSIIAKAAGLLSIVTAGTATLISGAIVSLVTAPLFLLMVLKVGRSGAIFLHSLLYSLLFLLAGLPHMIIFYMIIGLIGELMMLPHGTGYRSISRSVLTCSIFLSIKALHPAVILWIISNYNPQGAHSYTGAQLRQTMDLYFNPTMLALILILTFAGSLLGSYAGARILRRHFVRSGILRIDD